MELILQEKKPKPIYPARHTKMNAWSTLYPPSTDTHPHTQTHTHTNPLRRLYQNMLLAQSPSHTAHSPEGTKVWECQTTSQDFLVYLRFFLPFRWRPKKEHSLAEWCFSLPLPGQINSIPHLDGEKNTFFPKAYREFVLPCKKKMRQKLGNLNKMSQWQS